MKPTRREQSSEEEDPQIENESAAANGKQDFKINAAEFPQRIKLMKFLLDLMFNKEKILSQMEENPPFPDEETKETVSLHENTVEEHTSETSHNEAATTKNQDSIENLGLDLCCPQCFFQLFVNSRELSSVTCDECELEVTNNNYLSCRPCDYDLCVACAKR